MTQEKLDEYTADSGFYAEEGVPLSDVCRFMMRGKHPDYVDNSSVKVLNQKAVRWNEIQEEHLKYHNPDTDMFENRFLSEGDIVVNSTGVGTLGRCYYFRYTPDNMFADSHLTILRTEEDRLDPEYLYYILSSPEYQKKILNLASGSTGQTELLKRDITSIEISFPDIVTQKKIVKNIRPFDLLEKNNRNIIKNLDICAQNIFEGMFSYFNINLSTLKRDQEIDLPEGFEIKKLDDILSLEYGDGLPKREREGNKYPVYGSNGITGSHKESLIQGPGVIVGRKGTVGAISLSMEDFWPIDTTFYVEPKEDYGMLFYYHLLRTVPFQHLQSDSAVPGLNRDAALNQEVIVPPLEQAQYFSEKIQPLHKLRLSLKKENEKTRETKEAILPQCLLGNIDI